MTYEILIEALSLIVLLAGIVKPLLDLNRNITSLTNSVDQLRTSLNEEKSRIATHGKEIDKINVTLENHEVRITNLEK